MAPRKAPSTNELKIIDDLTDNVAALSTESSSTIIETFDETGITPVLNYYLHPKIKLPQTYNPCYSIIRMKHPILAGLIAPTGKGKSNVLLNLILHSGDTFGKIVIVHKVEEPLYDLLSTDLRKGDIIFLNNLTDLPLPNKLAEHLGLSSSTQIMVVFDDCMADKHQDVVVQYYIRGRKSNISSIYLSQKFHCIPIEIRAQFNYLLMLSIGVDHEIKKVLAQYSLGVSKEKMIKMYDIAVAPQFGFLKIDIYNHDPKLKFSRGFNNFSFE